MNSRIAICVFLVYMIASIDAGFCKTSKDSDQIDISNRQYNCEMNIFNQYYVRWIDHTRSKNFTNNQDLTWTYQFMRNESVAVGFPSNLTDNRGGFIFTKTTGDILIDATLPLDQAIFPNIVTHGGRYEFSKAQLCREEKITVYNSYFVPRLQKYFRFYARATRAGVDREWTTFRIHIERDAKLAQCA